ncbi:MAG: response regulator [Alphaproteobacteria bacterium]|nr:response regulator [Alphaproteobacteria bacterium]
MKFFKPLSEHIGRRIRDRRQRARMTLSDLAQKLEVSIPQVEKYEQGVNRTSVEILYKLGQIFKVSPDFFFQDFTYDTQLSAKFVDSETISIKGDAEINILLIEDNPADEFIIRKFIKECPNPSNIFTVHDGQQALELLRNQPHTSQFTHPDIIILDLNIPKRDGHTVLKEIKRDPRIQAIPVIIVTNSLKREEMIEVYRRYASGYICKSSDLDLFKSQIQSLIHYWSFAVVLPRLI